MSVRPVISAQNRRYHAWQAFAAVYSCLERQHVEPVLVVHGGIERPPCNLFLAAERAGAILVLDRDYQGHGAYDWSARNAVASLRTGSRVARELGDDRVALMDPDMVWAGKVGWPRRKGSMAVDVDAVDLELLERASIREYVRERHIPWPEDARKLGARVPYVVPVELADGLGEAWWQVLEGMCALPDRHWSDQMCAFSVACKALGVQVHRSRLSQVNGAGAEREPLRAPLVHYAYASRRWSKTWYTEEGDWSDLWYPPELPEHTVQGWVMAEIRRAGVFLRRLLAEEGVA